MNNDNDFKIISIYIDSRNSTKMSSENKIKMIKKLYNKFKNFEIILDNISKTGKTLYSGDAVILNFKVGKLNAHLIELLAKINEDVLNISDEKYKFGIGVAYGYARTFNINNEQETMIGNVIDLAARASDISMKNNNNNYLFSIFRKNKSNDISNGLNEELLELIKGSDEFKHKSTNSGNFLKFNLNI